MDSEHRLHPRLAAGLVFLTLAASVFAEAGVTVKGKVEYWDQLRGAYFPCRHVHVEVEGDWFWFPDPDVTADQNGRYSVTISDPPFFWGDYDGVDIEIYAETDNVIQVFSSMVSWWPYHAISHETDNVQAGQTVTIDVRIGGPANTAKEAYYRTMEETANAFALHDRALEEHRTLRSLGWPAGDFDETEILVPAASPTGISYYNHATGFVNIAVASAGLSGLGSWAVLAKGNYPYGSIENIRHLVQHEYAHGIHDEITGPIAPLGLSMPMYHSPEMESNRYVAFTEGVAYFLPLAVNNNPQNLFEASREIEGQYAAVDSPKSGDHYAMEAEVTGLLWDIYDGVGPEPFRHPAERTADKVHAVPKQIVDAQRWTDRIQDPKLLKFREVARTYVPAWPVMTIGEFLDVYHQKFPGELHALKSIAYNRDITVNMPGENPAALAGSPKISRIGPKITLSLELEEQNPEDRPYVKVFVWLQKGAGVTFLSQTAEQKGWASGNLPLTFGFNLPVAAGPGDFLWIIVSDDMLPQAYRVGVPANMATVTLVPPPKPDLPNVVLQEKILPIDPAKDIVLNIPGRNVRARISQPDGAYARKINDFKSTFARARAALTSYGESSEAAMRRERGLYKLGRTLGDLVSSEPAEILFHDRPRQDVREEALRVSRGAPGAAEFEGWKARLREGGGLRRGLSGQEAADLQRILVPSERHSRRAASSTLNIPSIQTALRNSLGGILQGQQEADLSAETRRAVEELDKTLSRAAADTALIPLLETQEDLVGIVAGASRVGKDTVRQQERPIQEEETIREGREAASRPRTPIISGRWRSNILAVYEISQQGDRFTWKKIGTKEVGQGTISGTAVSASWTGGGPPGSTSGEIVEIDSDGTASRIVWKNGVVFIRN